jgi:putative sterol carrier protein
MPDATTEFFDRLGQRGHEQLLEKTTGSLRFDLETDKGHDTWFVDITRGDVTVSHKRAKAACVMRTDAVLFEAMAEGRANLMAAIMRGVVGVEGDLTLLVQFQRLFPGPPQSRRREVAAAAEKGHS